MGTYTYRVVSALNGQPLKAAPAQLHSCCIASTVHGGNVSGIASAVASNSIWLL